MHGERRAAQAPGVEAGRSETADCYPGDARPCDWQGQVRGQPVYQQVSSAMMKSRGHVKRGWKPGGSEHNNENNG